MSHPASSPTTITPHEHHNGNDHPFHLVNPSWLPMILSLFMLSLTLGMVLHFHDFEFLKKAGADGKLTPGSGIHPGLGMIVIGILGTLICMGLWWKEVIKEGLIDKAHTYAVQHSLRLGMALFITSEVMFFVAFFWAFFSSSIFPKVFISDTWDMMTGIAQWPPAGIHPFDAWDLPFMNTLILLLSGTTVTWAHHALLEGNRRDVIRGLTCTVVLGVLFTCLQAVEYHHATFGLKDGIFASTFYLATGFHGAHVIIGTIFLFVNLVRARTGTLTIKGHLGFEFAAWYWHFVDAVWLFLFVFVYWWGGKPH